MGSNKRRNKMKTQKRITALTITALLTAGITLNFSGCSKESPLSATANVEQEVPVLAKPGAGSANHQVYPQYSSVTLRYQEQQNKYMSGTMKVTNGSYLQVDASSLKPPADYNGQDVTLNMVVEKDPSNGQLIYTFGISGCQFTPAAELWFDWHDLGSKKAKLFYIDENGEYIETEPQYEDKRGKKLMVRVKHFSRYALAHSE